MGPIRIDGPQDTREAWMFRDGAKPGRLRLFLIRHGHLENSEYGAINGQADVPLSARGRIQMDSRAETLRDVPMTRLFSSTLSRTKESLLPIAQTRPHLPPVEINGFRERSFGVWEGKTREEISREDPCGYARWQKLDVTFAPPGGESLLTFRGRVLGALDDLLDQTGYGQNVVLVAHSGVNRILLLHALGMDLSGYFRLTQWYGALNVIDYTEGGYPTVLLMNQPPEESRTGYGQ